MTFLQPILLWALPLALLPLLIHLLNRMRYRSVRWAAIDFLLRANKASTRHAKLRQFLILACRILALALLILAVARPLAGGWMGLMFSGAPDALVLLLDRSTSMETFDPGTQQTRRQRALELLAKAAQSYGGRTRIVLIENALLAPQEIGSADLLPKLSIAGPTDTAADLPAMLDAAATWLDSTKPGLTEIWIASDLQTSNWQPRDDRWRNAVARIQGHPQGARVRLLAFTTAPEENRAVEVADVQRQLRSGAPEVEVTAEFRRIESAPATLPVAVTFQEVRSQFEAQMDGQALKMRRNFPFDPAASSRWGLLELPSDANLRDNTAYFLAPVSAQRRVALVSSGKPAVRKLLQLAAAPAPEQLAQRCEVLAPQELSQTDWRNYALVIWQDSLPEGQIAAALQQYVSEGGVVLFFPPEEPNAAAFAGISWGDLSQAPSGSEPFRVPQWDHQDGPLADSEEGIVLPVAELSVLRRRQLNGERAALAAFSDGTAFLARKAVGRGFAWFCATLPEREWSTLGDGPVLIPMLMRLANEGATRFYRAAALAPGEGLPAANPDRWTRIIPSMPADVRIEAGIYRDHEGSLVAINRPAPEDEPDTLQPDAAKSLLNPLQVQWFEEKGAADSNLQAEVWRTILVALLIFLIAEAALILPPRTNGTQHAPVKTEKSGKGTLETAGIGK